MTQVPSLARQRSSVQWRLPSAPPSSSRVSMDRAAVGRNRHGQEEQGAHPVALVHPVVLSSGSRQYLRTYLLDALPKSQTPRNRRPNCHALSDWNRPLEEDASGGWRSAAAARNISVDHSRSGISIADPWRMDSPLADIGKRCEGLRRTARGTKVIEWGWITRKRGRCPAGGTNSYIWGDSHVEGTDVSRVESIGENRPYHVSRADFSRIKHRRFCVNLRNPGRDRRFLTRL